MTMSIPLESTLTSDSGAVLPSVRFCSTCRAVYVSDFARCPIDGGELVVSTIDPLIGTAVANYEVETYLGGGAMGRVYRCHHTHLHHKVFALKVLRGDLAATMAMRLRFTQEAEAASQLVHPNLVSVLDFGRTESGLLYIAMELVEGEPLSAVIARGPLDASRTIQLVRQICHGLAHAHERGFVHRDLKPDNILVVRDGNRDVPRIADFGLAIHADPNADSARLTTAGVLVGTPTYAAPEQMSNLGETDHRADLFALGVTMFELLAGRPPFDANLLETLHLNANGERPTIHERSGLVVPRRLEALVHKLMAPLPANRPSSTRVVLDELAAIELELTGAAAVTLAGAPLPAITQGQPVQRSRRRLAAAGLVMVAATTLLIAERTRTVPAVAPAPVSSPAVMTGAPTAQPAVVAPSAATVESIPVIATFPVAPPRSLERGAPRRKAARPNVIHSSTAAVAGEPPGAVPQTAAVEVSAPAEPVAPPAESVAPVHVVVAPAPVARPPVKVVTVAQIQIESLSVRGALTTSQINRALSRTIPAMRGCYAVAASAAHRSPTSKLRVAFAIDESQNASSIRITGGELAGLDRCVERALAVVRTETAPDVGTVDVGLVLTFTPDAP